MTPHPDVASGRYQQAEFAADLWQVYKKQGTDCPYAKEADNLAIREAENLLNSRGNSPRLCKNTLVFLAADRNRLHELDAATRYFLAWASIEADKETLNLDNFQTKQATTQKNNWDAAVESRIGETFQWLLVPTRPNPRAPVEWQATRLAGQDPLAVRASKKLKNDSQMVGQYASTLLRAEMDKVPLWRGNHVAVKQVLDDFAQYLYLQRVRNPEVLLAAIRDGVSLMMWSTESFAYADSWDESKQRYVGLQRGRMLTVTAESTSLLVKPDVAMRQIEAEKPPTGGITPPPGGAGPSAPGGVMPGVGGRTTAPEPAKLKRFHAPVRLDPTRIGRDAGRIAEEVVQHLVLLPDAEAEVVLEIQAEVPNGTPDNVVRTVTENCRTLKFDSQGFEKE